MTNRIQRAGDTVRRPASVWTPAVHGLLRHLRTAGFPAPRPLGTEGETEILTWIDGESGPAGWARIVPDSGLDRIPPDPVNPWCRELTSSEDK